MTSQKYIQVDKSLHDIKLVLGLFEKVGNKRTHGKRAHYFFPKKNFSFWEIRETSFCSKRSFSLFPHGTACQSLCKSGLFEPNLKYSLLKNHVYTYQCIYIYTWIRKRDTGRNSIQKQIEKLAIDSINSGLSFFQHWGCDLWCFSPGIYPNHLWKRPRSNSFSMRFQDDVGTREKQDLS